MKKKISSSVLAFMILTNSFSYAGAFDFKDNFLNTTNSTTWTDPSSGVTYHSGPNLEYRFQTGSKGYAPWLQFQMPSIRVGCNGFSIKGGFLALLGLDDIKQQLTDAGASFAWGVMIVLIEALPSVNDVFYELHSWARRIQSLLQNACQIGQNFAREKFIGSGVNSFFNGLTGKGPSVIKDAMAGVDSFLDSIEKYTTPSTANRIVGEQTQAVGSNISMLSMALGESIQSCNELNHMYRGSVKQILEGNLDNCVLKDNPSVKQFQDGVQSYVITRAIFGDIAVNAESITRLTEKFDEDGTLNMGAAQNALRSAASHDAPLFGVTPNFSPVAPAISDPREAALWFIFGDNGSTVGMHSTTSVKDSKKIFISDSDVLYINMDTVSADKQELIDPKNLSNNPVVSNGSSTSTGTGSSTSKGTGSSTSKGTGSSTSTGTGSSTTTTVTSPPIKAIFLVNKSNYGQGKIELKWGGAYEGSKNNILYYVNKALIAKLGNKASNYTGTTIIPNRPDNTVPMVTSNMNGYANIIVEDILATGSMEHTMPLIDLLALYNAQVYSEQLLANITNRVYNAQNAPNVSVNDQNQQLFFRFNSETKQVASEIRNEIYKMKQSLIKDTQSVDNLFNQVKRNTDIVKSKMTNKSGGGVRTGTGVTP